MKITLARHYGLCFGVRDALRQTHDSAASGPVTILGQLVHNPVVTSHLRTLGALEGRLDDLSSAPTRDVVITAHGASESHRRAWREAGFRLTDTTCPLVRKAHTALARLVAEGFSPVVIGKKGHVEVMGLIGDFPEAIVIESADDLTALPFAPRLGVVSQTTQPVDRVRRLIEFIRRRHPEAEVRHIDTVCQPTKDRQKAVEDLCVANDVIVVVGGRNSNNTKELVSTARRLGTTAYQVEFPHDLDPAWFEGVETVGVTAGTSTLDESVQAVMGRLRLIAAEGTEKTPQSDFLRLFA